MGRLIALMIVACLGGCGTFMTRIFTTESSQGTDAKGQHSDFVGAYPYSAVGGDVALLMEGIDGRGPSPDPASTTDRQDQIACCVISAFLAILSLPIDLAVDTVLLPADLVAWPFGWRRGWHGLATS